MAFLAHAMAMAISTATPTSQSGEPATAPCRPAPYMVAERAQERPRKDVLTLPGRVERAQFRSGRPCLLMRGEVELPRGLRIAALS